MLIPTYIFIFESMHDQMCDNSHIAQTFFDYCNQYTGNTLLVHLYFSYPPLHQQGNPSPHAKTHPNIRAPCTSNFY
jgi:hypothetical protein